MSVVAPMPLELEAYLVWMCVETHDSIPKQRTLESRAQERIEEERS